ncbi:MAG TPA: GGDEF domain-containing protein, partial [Gemmataceae bacterium]|nr:GGDEF domain-containing protein [Gemmataceae bacterium]
RYGGEEFVVVLPESTLDSALCVGERIRSMVEKHDFVFENQSFHITISLGIAAITDAASLTPSELIRLADERLYQAKRAGRNRIVA